MASTGRLARKTKNYLPSCRHIAQRRETTFKDIPIEKLIPLGVCANISHLTMIDPKELAERVWQIYDSSYLYHDWQRYCNALGSEHVALATIGMFLAFSPELHTNILKRAHCISQKRVYRHSRVEIHGCPRL